MLILNFRKQLLVSKQVTTFSLLKLLYEPGKQTQVDCNYRSRWI